MTEQKFVLNKPVPVEETRHYEFKEVKGRNPVDAIKNTADEYVVAFLNSEGGRIYWGIRDSDRMIVGVRLSFEERDRLRRGIVEKLMNIQPPIAPSAYRVVLHEVFEDEDSARGVSDLFVVEVVVPRVFTNELFFTGGNEAFVKTDAGKRKLTGLEQYDEIRRRLISEGEHKLVNQSPAEVLEANKRKRWRGLEQCLSLASGDTKQSPVGYGRELAVCLHETFTQSGYINFNGMLRLEEVREDGQFFRLYNLICHQVEFCAVVNRRETAALETAAAIKEKGFDERGRSWDEARADMARELEAIEREWQIIVDLIVSENFLPIEFSYDPASKRIIVRTLRDLSANPDDYPDRVTKTSEVLQYIASMANGRIGIFDDFYNPAKQNYPLIKLIFAASKGEFDLNNLRINVNDYEEWDYINSAFSENVPSRGL